MQAEKFSQTFQFRKINKITNIVGCEDMPY